MSASVTATASPTPSVSAPSLSGEFVDRLDGSTAAIPLAQAALKALRGTGEGMAFNTTPTAYDNLIAGAKDLILVSYPSQEEFAAAKAAGIELEIVPLVKDGLVFLVNTANPVSGLTRQQIKDIYTGAVTDWGQVGGAPGAIIPYQRPVGSGSQTLFLQEAMNGVTPLDAPTEVRPASMEGLVDVIAAMDNGPTSLGFSVFYYATQMYLKDTVKLLAVDGVAPSAQTISAGAYPYITFVNAVFRKDTPADSPVRGFVDWLLGDDAQKIASAANYVPLDGRNIVAAEPVYHLGANPQNTTISSGTGGTQPRPLFPLPASAYSCDDQGGTAPPVLTVNGHPEVGQATTQWLEEQRAEQYSTGCNHVTVYQDLVSVSAATAAGGLEEALFDMATGRRLSLSDLFYDGVNYIRFINDNLMNPWTNQAIQTWSQATGQQYDDGAVLRFTGIPSDYPSFDLGPWGLNIGFPDGNPFVSDPRVNGDIATSLRLPLPAALSPYGAVWRLDYQAPPGASASSSYAWAVPVVSTGFPALRASDAAVNAAIAAAARAPGVQTEEEVLYGSRLSVTFRKQPGVPESGSVGAVVSMVTMDLNTGEPAPFSEADIPARWWTVPNTGVRRATGDPALLEGYVPPAGTTYRYVRLGYGAVDFEIVEPSGRVLEVNVPV